MDNVPVEEIESFNETFGIKFSGLSGGQGRHGYYYVSGEVLSSDGSGVDKPFRIMAAAFDHEGRVIGVGNKDISAASLYGILAFEIFLGRPPEDARVTKYRVFPQPPR
jgi:hypothetical protein